MSTSTRTEKQRKRVHPPISDLTGDEMFESLTGFEEMAVKARFGVPINDLAKVDQLQLGRALVFADLKRQDRNLKDKDAHDAAQAMELGVVLDYFSDEPDEPFEDEPVTDAGKDDTPPAGRHAT